MRTLRQMFVGAAIAVATIGAFSAQEPREGFLPGPGGTATATPSFFAASAPSVSPRGPQACVRRETVPVVIGSGALHEMTLSVGCRS